MHTPDPNRRQKRRQDLGEPLRTLCAVSNLVVSTMRLILELLR